MATRTAILAFHHSIRHSRLIIPKRLKYFKDKLKDLLEAAGCYSGTKAMSSQYRGVWWDTRKLKWRAAIKIGGVKYHIGTYDDEEEAARDFQLVEAHKGSLSDAFENIEEDDSRISKKLTYFKELLKSVIHVNGLETNRRRVENTSSFRGVSRHKHSNSWTAEIRIAGLKCNIGSYDTETEASEAYELVHAHRDVLTNEMTAIVEDDPRQKKRVCYFKEFAEDLFIIAGLDVPFESRTSYYRGVQWQPGLHKWRTRITVLGANYHIGYYTSELEASDAYERVLALRPLLQEKLAEMTTARDRLDCFKQLVFFGDQQSSSI